MIGPQIFATIKGALMDPELEEIAHRLPCVAWTSVSPRHPKVAMLTTAHQSGHVKNQHLTEAEQAAIATHGAYDLSTFLPKKPGTSVELKVIKEMFEASVDGQPYDAERWGQYYPSCR
jgi:hypothetical protein